MGDGPDDASCHNQCRGGRSPLSPLRTTPATGDAKRWRDAAGVVLFVARERRKVIQADMYPATEAEIPQAMECVPPPEAELGLPLRPRFLRELSVVPV